MGTFLCEIFFRLEAIRNGEATPILDRLVYRKIRALLGGRMRLMLAGGAPLSKEVHEFMRVCIGCPLLQVRMEFRTFFQKKFRENND